MYLYFFSQNGQLSIDKEAQDDEAVKVKVSLNSDIKRLLKDFIEAYNISDPINRHLHLSLIVLRFSEYADTNQEAWEYILFAWGKSLIHTHSHLENFDSNPKTSKPKKTKSKLKRRE